ncbi:MAG TPA: PLDc N-terminal domain-containing protein [Thermoleophilaceae bacterium]|nr:PLDc N-terminal domain-containing protein [Thermoleophilaceae bacterium]
MTVHAASTAVWVFILVPLAIVWALGVVDILRRDLSGRATAAWLLIVLLLPLVGTLIYFIQRKPTGEEIRLAQRAGAARRDSWPKG